MTCFRTTQIVTGMWAHLLSMPPHGVTWVEHATPVKNLISMGPSENPISSDLEHLAQFQQRGFLAARQRFTAPKQAERDVTRRCDRQGFQQSQCDLILRAGAGNDGDPASGLHDH